MADDERSDATICLAVSPSLKAIGVPSRPRLFEAKRAIQNYERSHHTRISYITAVPRMALYEKVSAQIYSIILRYAAPCDVHVYSVDESFIDAAPYLSQYEEEASRQGVHPAHVMAMTMIRDVLKETGITATVGIGTNLYLAKVCMDTIAKKAAPDKDGVRIAELNEDSYKFLLWDHRPLTDFWMLGPGKARTLEKACLFTMGDIAGRSQWDEEWFYKKFGIDGEILIAHAWGLDPVTMADIKSYHSDGHSLSNGQVLPRAYSFEEAQLAIKEQAELLSLQMVKEKVTADSMTMYVGYEVCSPGYTGQYRIDCYGRKVPSYSGGTIRFGTFTNYSKQIIPAAVSLYQRIAKPELKVRRIFLTVNHVRSERDICFQLDLFSDYGGMERQKRLEKAILTIKARYGANAILRGISLCNGARTMERNTQIGGHKA